MSSDSESESDVEYQSGDDALQSDSALKNATVEPDFAQRIHKLKWNFYDKIVNPPEPTTPKAQKNELIVLDVYQKQLVELCELMKRALCGQVVDAEMLPFPPHLRHEILACTEYLQKRYKNKINAKCHATDDLPYKYFFEMTLIEQPFNHRYNHPMTGEAVDVEDM